ncbi:MAG TPA: hypothetical protein PLU46_03740 [Thiotrichales bacterium]|jgi:hypothetical protein|nr:MAG: hypothetical protein B7X85_00095 [Thiotrichales bacterium 17-46-47]HQT01978.1 hypothetical protein [Thiotrichales bacterium]HQT04080.1 hypothetical protein [Thiotrichales bacterium]
MHKSTQAEQVSTSTQPALFDQLANKLSMKIRWANLLLLVLIGLVLWFESSLSMEATSQVVNAALAQAGVAFALDRALDATISLFASTTVGVGLNVNIGAILDPVDSIIEDFATVLQWAIGSLLLQKLLLSLTFHPIFTYLMWFFGSSIIIAMLFRLDKLAPTIVKIFLSMALIKFSMVLIIVANGYVDKTFIHNDVEAAIAKTQGIEDQLRREASSLPKSTSTEQNAAWNQEKEMLKVEQQNLIEQQRQHQDQLNALQANATLIQQQIDERNAQTAITDRLKKMWHNDELDQQLSTLKTDISEIESIMNSDTKRLTRLNDDLLRLDNLINGKPNSWVETVANQTKGIVDKYVPKIPSMDQLKNKLEETASSLVNLMAMFVIKSIVMPMVFLYVLFIINKMLWRLDLQMMLQSSPKAS